VDVFVFPSAAVGQFTPRTISLLAQSSVGNDWWWIADILIRQNRASTLLTSLGSWLDTANRQESPNPSPNTLIPLDVTSIRIPTTKPTSQSEKRAMLIDEIESMVAVQLTSTSSFPAVNLQGSNIGTVKFFNVQKGFGFITRDDDKKDFFVHVTGIRTGIVLNDHDQVTFEIEEGRKGLMATDVTIQ
jgi:CspA family cold shock protein